MPGIAAQISRNVGLRCANPTYRFYAEAGLYPLDWGRGVAEPAAWGMNSRMDEEWEVGSRITLR